MSEWFPIEEYGTSHSWRSFRKYSCSLKDEQGWGNVIGFKSEKLLSRFEEKTKKDLK